MSDSMVEGVARALCTAQGFPQEAWPDQVFLARAAISAMREPTDAMEENGEVWLSEAAVPTFLEIPPEDGARTAQGVWRAMIDAALAMPEPDQTAKERA